MPLDIHGNDLLKYKKDITLFIETGTANGNGVTSALNAGFQKIYSVELSEQLYNESKNKFQNTDNVTLICGSSEFELPKIIEQTNQPFLLWLDAHTSGGPYIGEAMHHYLPREINSISHLKEKLTHSVIMIDDMGYYLHDKEFCTLIENMVKELKPNGTLSYYNRPNTDHVILVSE